MRRFTYLAPVAALLLSAGPAAAESAPFIRSDFDQNGTLDIADPAAIARFLFSGRENPGCLDAGDVNDDGELDISDVLFPLVHLFLEGAPPASPYPDCGRDPTRDRLTCETSLFCAPPVPNIRDALGHCGGIPSSQYPNSLVRGDDLHKVTLSDPKAVCNDGSPAVLFVRSAPEDSPHSDRWIFYLQGGGGCASYEECRERWCSIGTIYDESKMSSVHTPESIGGTGIFLRDSENPLFENALGGFNQVFVYYCSSDSWTGRADDAVLTDPDDPTRRFSMHYRGHSIIEAALRALMPGGLESDDGVVAMPPLEAAETALLTGFSAGSGGVLHNGDWFASVLERNATTVRLVRSAALNPPADTHPDPAVAEELGTLLESTYQYQWETVFRDLRNAFVDESCRAAYEEIGEEWRCLDKPYVAFNHITTPYFEHIDLLDRGSQEMYEESYGIDPRDYALMMETTLLRLKDVPDTAVESDSIRRAPGAVGTLCGDHAGLMSTSIFFRRTVDDATGVPRNYHDSLVRWLAGYDVQLVDDPESRTTDCGDARPENE